MADSPQQQPIEDGNYGSNVPQTENSPDPQLPQPIFLNRSSGTSLFVFGVQEPDLKLDVDGVVVPCDPSGNPLIKQPLIESTLGSDGMGYMFGPMLEELGSRWQGGGRVNSPVALSLPSVVAVETAVSPTDPLVIHTDERGKTAVSTLIAVTPFVPFEGKADDLKPSPTAAAQATRAAIQLAAQRNIKRLLLPILIDDTSYAEGTAVAAAMAPAVREALKNLTSNPLQAIIFVTERDDISAHLQQITARKTSLIPSNDMPSGRDLLNIETEAHSLTEMLMLRNVEPPLCVGILGGWGSGKSFFMNLMRNKMNDIRSQQLTETEAWLNQTESNREQLAESVGHIYQIEFNAWTYAKSDLWASLMQTVFSELNRQLTLEKRLEALDSDKFGPLKGGSIWRVLNQMQPDEQEAILESELGKVALETMRTDELSNATADSLWSALEEVRRDERNKLRSTETEINRLNTALATKLEAVSRQVDQEIEKKAETAVWQPLLTQLSHLWQVAENEMQTIIDFGIDNESGTTDDQRTRYAINILDPDTRQTLHWLWSHRNDRWTLIIFFLSVAVAFILPFLQMWLQNLSGIISGLMFSSLIPAAGTAVHLFRKTEGWRRQINDLRQSYQTQVQVQMETLHNSRESIMATQLEEDAKHLDEQMQASGNAAKTVREMADAQDNIAAMQRRKAQLEVQAERQRQRIGLTADYVSIAEFVSNRLSSDSYQPRLGLMQQVKTDLDALTDGLTVHKQDVYAAEKQKMFPRGPARIVLFIDDLDRCPPNRVVEMFEAAQLLLKTKLFVVVLALDVRYVSRSLEKVYKGILSRYGDPSGLDYIEKIIQIPYRIRPIDGDALPDFLDKQMNRTVVKLVDEGIDHEDGGQPVQQSTAALSGGQAGGRQTAVSVTTAITFTTDESKIIHACCEQIELTPRSVKRMINVFKLIKLIWNRNMAGEQSIEIIGAVGLLLALSARYPEIMRGVFNELGQHLKHQPNQQLNQILQNYLLPINEQYLQNEYDQWKHAAENLAQKTIHCENDIVEIGNIWLNQLGENNFNLIRSFCFVGDVGFDANDAIVNNR